MWRLLVDPETDTLTGKVSEDAATDHRELERALHAAIKKVTRSVTDLRFNTAIAEMDDGVPAGRCAVRPHARHRRRPAR